MYQFSKEMLEHCIEVVKLPEEGHTVQISKIDAYIIGLVIRTHIELVDRINGNFPIVTKEA